MSTGDELERITTTGPGDTHRPKLATRGKFHSQSGFDDTPCRRLAKRGGHGSARTGKEGGDGRGGGAVDAAGSAGRAVLLHRGGTFAFACFMAWALVRSLRRLTNQVRHSCD